MTDGAHVLMYSLGLELHVQEHAPDAPGGEVVMVDTVRRVRAHVAQLILVHVLPPLFLHQGLVLGGDVGVHKRLGPGGCLLQL